MKYCCAAVIGCAEKSWGHTPQDAYNALFNHLQENEWSEDEIPGPDACIFYKMVPIEIELKMSIVEV